jgi:hypothetical protein
MNMYKACSHEFFANVMALLLSAYLMNEELYEIMVHYVIHENFGGQF